MCFSLRNGVIRPGPVGYVSPPGRPCRVAAGRLSEQTEQRRTAGGGHKTRTEDSRPIRRQEKGKPRDRTGGKKKPEDRRNMVQNKVIIKLKQLQFFKKNNKKTIDIYYNLCIIVNVKSNQPKEGKTMTKIEPKKRSELKALEKFHWKAVAIVGEYSRGCLTYQESMEYLMKKAVNSKYSNTLVYYLAEAITAHLNETKMIEIASDIYNTIMEA